MLTYLQALPSHINVIQVIFRPSLLRILPGSDIFAAGSKCCQSFCLSVSMVMLSPISLWSALASIGFSFGLPLPTSNLRKLAPSPQSALIVGVGNSSAVLVVIGFFILLWPQIRRYGQRCPQGSSLQYSTAIGEALQYGYGRADVLIAAGIGLNEFGRWSGQWVSGLKKSASGNRLP